MPKSTVLKKKKFREFSKLDRKYLKRNYLKNIRSAKKHMVGHGVSVSHLEFMLWCYDLEFFTIDYATEELEMNKSKMADRIIYPMVRNGLLYKHFDKLTPSQTEDDHLFRDETKYNYRVRYALTQRGRILVQQFYRLSAGPV